MHWSEQYFWSTMKNLPSQKSLLSLLLSPGLSCCIYLCTHSYISTEDKNEAIFARVLWFNLLTLVLSTVSMLLNSLTFVLTVTVFWQVCWCVRERTPCGYVFLPYPSTYSGQSNSVLKSMLPFSLLTRHTRQATVARRSTLGKPKSSIFHHSHP